MFYRKRNLIRRTFFAAIETAKGKVREEILEDIVDTAKHNEPELALELLIYQIWEGGFSITNAEYDRLCAAHQMFGLGEDEKRMLDECLLRGD